MFLFDFSAVAGTSVTKNLPALILAEVTALARELEITNLEKEYSVLFSKMPSPRKNLNEHQELAI